MFDFNKLAEGYVRHYNRLFWLFFVIAGALFVSSVFLGALGELYIEIILGFLLAVVGIHRTGEEFLNKRVRETQDASIRTINELLQWAEKSYDYTRAFKERHEKRLFHLDERRADLENKLESQFRLAVKKIIDLENRMNRGLRTTTVSTPAAKIEITPMAPAAKPAARSPSPEGRLADLSRSQLRAIQFLRREGSITNKDYRRLFRISDKKAYNELAFLHKLGLIKRVGKGRNTHYLIGF
jgi:uncharacterized membrane protein